MKMKRIALSVGMMFAGCAYAGELIKTPNVDVTAAPIIEAVNVDDYASTSAVVTDNQLRDQNAVDLASALRRTPGVQISRYNPVGAFGGEQGGAVFIRGMGVSRPGSEVKTYVDGVPFYMGVWGHPLLDLLPINGMQSITVYKSPQPQINGNNFASINLETKRPTEDGLHGDGRISAGSFGTVIQQATLLGRTGAIDFMLAEGYAKSNGHRSNADGELKNAMGRIGAQFNEHWRGDISFLYVDNEAKDPGDARVAAPAIAPEYKSRAGMITASLAHAYDNLKGEIKLYSNHGEGNLYNDNRPNGWGTFLTNFEMSGMHWKEQLSAWTGGTIRAGLDIDRISGDVKGPFTGGTVNMPDFRITSPYIAVAQLVPLNDTWTLEPSAGIRFYDHSQYKTQSAPHAGLALISDKATIFANFSKGINYPGLEAPALQTALPFMFAGTTWQRLAPEEVDHAEVGLKLTPFEGTQVDVSVFRDHVKNRYVYDLSFASTAFYNTGSYFTNGAEIAIKQKFGEDWAFFGGLTLLNPNIAGLPYTPDTAITAGLNGHIGPIRIAIDSQYQSKVLALNRDRNTLNPNTESVSAFAVLNARASYPLPALGKKGEVFLAVENLFDANYAYRPGYQMPGIFGQIGLSASF